MLKFHEIFQKGVLKYFKILMKFLNISKWNISSCISMKDYAGCIMYSSLQQSK